ncbi:MAG: TIGR02597 family protein [Burkholderiales bacterium]|nr:TIGR02597 family protein [Opitutaceae bacterium]
MLTSRSTLTLLAAFAALGGFFSFANAQSVATTPVGAMTYSFAATGGSPVTSYMAVPLNNPSVYSGPVASLSSTTVTFAGTPFSAGQLAQAGSPFFARISTGAQAGRTVLITANTTNSITLDVTDHSSQTTNLDASGFAVAVGDRIEVIVGDTLASFFGDNTSGNPVIFPSTAFLSSSDTLSIYNKATAKFSTYFYSTTLGYWRLSNSTVNANNTVLYPEDAVGILRRANRLATSITVLGEVPAVKPLTKITSASSVFASIRVPAPMTLAQLQLANWTKSNFLSSADTVSIYNSATGRFDVYFQRADNSQWRKSGGGTVDQSSLVIQPDSVVGYLKRGSVSEATSYLSSPLPYTL